MSGVIAAGLLAACSADPTVADVELAIRCAPATSWTFPETAVGQTSSVVIQVTPVAGSEGALPALAIDGRDAAAFTLDEGGSTCDNLRTLAAGDVCIVFVAFAPTAERAHSAAIHIGSTVLPLDGLAVAKPRGLFATVRNVDSVQGFYNVGTYQPMLLTNEGTTAAVLGAPVVSGTGMTVGPALQCPATLAPGAACEISVSVQQRIAGCVAGSFQLPSSVNTIEIPITSMFIGGVSVGMTGAGRGRVVSSPPGIDCGPDRPASGCEHPFFGPVTLSAIADPSHHFNGWSDIACDHQASCVVTPGAPGDSPGAPTTGVAAAFASPQAHAVDVTFAGGGTGLISGAVRCASSCQAWIEDGVRSMVAASTTSVFGGWAGACSGADAACDLGLVIRDRALTVTFTPDEHELTTLFPAGLRSIARGAMAADGDLVIADANVGEPAAAVARLSPAGALRWSTSLGAISPTSLRIAPGGEIYVLGSIPQTGEATLIKLAATGDILWKQAAPSGALAMAVAANGDLVIATGGPAGSVHRLAPDGTTRWSAASPDAVAIAIDSTGMTAVASGTGIVSRFDAAGAPLAPSWALPAHLDLRIALAFDAQDFLLAQTRWDPYSDPQLHSYVLTRLDRTGTAVLSKEIIDRGPEVYVFPIARDGGIAISGTRTFSWISHAYTASHGFHQNAGGQLELYTTTGERAWGVDKLAIPTPSSYGLNDGVVISDAACDAAGRCAVFGTYSNRIMRRPWIELFTLP